MTDTTLKDGTTTTDRRLDRLVQFDEASRLYPIRTLVRSDLPLRSRTWTCSTWLDQGNEGACVGFSWSHNLSCYSTPIRGITDDFARDRVYHPSQLIDEWPGEAYDGTSVLAGAKTVKSLGYIEEYRWAFSVDEALHALGLSAVVCGFVWLQSMFHPRPSGLLEVDRGEVAGGHAICARGVTLAPRLKGESAKLGPVVRFRNSWGRGWGANGDCFVKAEDFEWLQQQQGEVCIPVGKKRLPA
jgi:hypothetical protein